MEGTGSEHFLPVPFLLFSLDPILDIFAHTTVIETRQNNVVFGIICGKDTAPTRVSMRIQNEVFSECAHSLFTVRLRGSAAQFLVLLNLAEKAHLSTGTVCNSLVGTAGVSKRV